MITTAVILRNGEEISVHSLNGNTIVFFKTHEELRLENYDVEEQQAETYYDAESDDVFDLDNEDYQKETKSKQHFHTPRDNFINYIGFKNLFKILDMHNNLNLTIIYRDGSNSKLIKIKQQHGNYDRKTDDILSINVYNLKEGYTSPFKFDQEGRMELNYETRFNSKSNIYLDIVNYNTKDHTSQLLREIDKLFQDKERLIIMN